MAMCYLLLSNHFHVYDIGGGQVYHFLTGNCRAKDQQPQFLILFLTANDNEFCRIKTCLNPVPDDIGRSLASQKLDFHSTYRLVKCSRLKEGYRGNFHILVFDCGHHR
jgi:hypothetical protein